MKTWSTPVLDQEKETVPCILCGSKVFTTFLNCEGFGYVRCKCGLVQMNPQPQKDDLLARYSKVYGKEYLQYELENEAAFLRLQILALKDAGFFKKVKGVLGGNNLSGLTTNFLDVGCATGALIEYLAKYGYKVTGVEISPSAEYAVKERKLDVRTLPLEENNFPSKSFDIIHASHLIEHLKDPRSFLTEVRRLLKDNGCIYITTPNINGLQAHLFKSRWRSAIFDHLYLFSVNTLKKLAINTGFKVECVRTWGGLAADICPKWLKKIADSLAKIFGFGDVMIIKCVVSK